MTTMTVILIGIFAAVVLGLIAMALYSARYPMPDDPEGDKEASGW
jgi:uncharacterized membrane protein